MGRSYTVAPVVIDKAMEIVQTNRSNPTRRKVELMVTRRVRGSIPDSHGLYRINLNGNPRTVYIACDPLDEHKLEDLLTPEEVRQLGYI